MNTNLNDLNVNINTELANSLIADAMQNLRVEVGNGNSELVVNKNLNKITTSRNFKTFTEKQAQKRRNAQLAQTLKDILEKVLLEYETNIQEEEFHLKEQIKELGLSVTSNPNFLVDKNNFYYELIEHEYVRREDIIHINENGDYTTKELCDRYYLLVTYNQNNKPIAYQCLNRHNSPSLNKDYIAERFSLKKEWAKKHKLKGYSGDFANFYLRMLNAMSPLHTTGCYMDENYNFFKWNYKTSQFEIEYRIGSTMGAPTIADYEILTDKIVRTDYDGIIR